MSDHAVTRIELPAPKVANWQRLYQPGARVRCIADSPPMYGFGEGLTVGDVVKVDGVCWRAGHYEVGVREQCAFYRLEGYFEVCADEPHASEVTTSPGTVRRLDLLRQSIDNMMPIEDASNAESVSCPECGAEPGAQCSVPDPADDRLGIEVMARVHFRRAERAERGA
jgi:hypothetical protein